MFSFCDYDHFTLCHLNVHLSTQHWFKGCTSCVDTTIPGSGLCLCYFVVTEYNTGGPKQDLMSQRYSNRQPGGHMDQTPKPTVEGTQQPWKQKDRAFFCFLLWESCIGSSPSQQSWALLVQGFPHCHGYNNTRPIRLTGPVTPRHAKTHRNWPQTGSAYTQAHLP